MTLAENLHTHMEQVISTHMEQVILTTTLVFYFHTIPKDKDAEVVRLFKATKEPIILSLYYASLLPGDPFLTMSPLNLQDRDRTERTAVLSVHK